MTNSKLSTILQLILKNYVKIAIRIYKAIFRDSSMKKIKCRAICFLIIAICLLLAHFAIVAYIHTKYVHIDGSFWEHFLFIRHLTIDEILNRVLTTIIVLIFAVISMIFYQKLYLSKEQLKNLHDELEKRYSDVVTSLKQQQKFISQLLDFLPVAAFVIDKRHKVLFWNRACENLTGIKRDNILNTDEHWKAFYDEKKPLLADLVLDFTSIEECRARYDRFEESKLIEGGFYAEKNFANLGGKERYIVFETTPIKDEKGEIVAVIETLQDITEIKKLYQDLKERNEVFEKLVNSTSAAIFIYDETGFKFGNRMCELISGYTLEELYKMNYFEIVHPEMREIMIERATRRLKGEDVIKRYEIKIVTKAGETKWLDFTSDLIEYRGKKMAIGTAYDITEKKMLEEAFIHSQKLEAIGRLSAGVAHDFNNILTGIIGFASLIQMLSTEENIKKQAANILYASENAADLTKSLLAFSRKQIFNIKKADINNLLQNINKLIKRVIGEDIHFELQLYNQPLISKVDSAQIESAILNLVANARDAMPDGGVLKIKTDIYYPDDFFLKRHEVSKDEKFAIITVSDTGIGIPENIRERIFEPFFTTKGPGKGTGLGLASVYGIVRQHNGFIELHSVVGKGTTFEIYLPLTDEPLDKEVLPSTENNLKGNETILLVEDDDMVRLINKESLELFGYKVIEARDGLEGLEKFNELKDKIDLVILDVVMPVMNGMEVYSNIKKIKKDTKSLFMSGYPESFVQKEGIIDISKNFISKPVSPSELAKKVRFVLNNN